MRNFLKIQKRFWLIFVVIIIFIAIYKVQDLKSCNLLMLKEKIKTPSGVEIPKYVASSHFISFGNLSKECKYNNQNEIVCPDVRHFGETMHRQVLLTITRMLAIINLICERHSIKYWLLAGTLLGSYRSNKLIPWDDDGDIGMLLEDYQQFLKHVRNELPEDLYFQDGSDDIHFRSTKFVNAKIRDRNSCYGYCIRKGCQWHDGIQIDIFVFLKKQDNPDVITSTFPRFEFNSNNIFPNKKMFVDGVFLSVPAESHKVLSLLYGSDYLDPISNACPSGRIPIPWYSCEYLGSLSLNDRIKTLKESEIHSNFLFQYI
ncbi:uncharacterized protein LOC136077910 [Hydra vulgaris]|uniref:Uncharacterized protein LOC136077910 n=1 Tax=Hydra vulgaris TaxID=6087 RepID=A0ABM4BGY3_HYDVU